MFIPETITVLYIEDDALNVEKIKTILKGSKHTNFNVVHKESLKLGLEYLGKKCEDPSDCKIDVILLDLLLPNSQGVETYTTIRDACPFLPVVITSRHEDIACECVKVGAQDYLLNKELENSSLLIRSLKYSIERTKLEESKIISEKKFREVIYSTPVGFHNYELKDNQLIFTSFNPAANEILNTDNAQFIGKTIQEAFPNLTETEIPKRYMEVVETGEVWSGGIVEYEDEHIEKGFFRVHVFRTSPGCITASFDDITDQIAMENKYKELVEATHAAIYEIDFTKDKFIYVNDVMCRLTGWTREEFMELKPSELLTEESRNKWMQRWEALQRGEFIPSAVEYEANTKDGSTIWTLLTAKYTEDQSGSVIGARVVAIDITDRKVAQEEAERKEEIIFTELESRIKEWKEDMTTRPTVENKLHEINLDIISMTNKVEVL